MKTKQDLLMLFTAFVISSGLIFLSPYFIVPVVCCTVMWALERHKQIGTITELETRVGQFEDSHYKAIEELRTMFTAVGHKIPEMEAEITKLRAANSMKFGSK